MKEMVLSHHAASSQSLAQLIESAKGTGFDPEQEIIFRVDATRGGYVMQQAEAEDDAGEAPPAEIPDREPFIPAPVVSPPATGSPEPGAGGDVVEPTVHDLHGAPAPTAQDARTDASDDEPKDPDDDHDDNKE